MGYATDGTYLYWTNYGDLSGGTTIGRANLDGTDVNGSFITGASTPAGITVSGSYIYWVNTGMSIARANIDGTGADRDLHP